MDCETEIKNGTIESTYLGCEDHGIMTAWIHILFDGSGQAFGGLALDAQPATPMGDRQPHAICGAFIAGVLNAMGVGSWEKLKGQNVRVKREGGRIIAIGHIVKNRWFCLSDIMETI